MGMTIGSGIPRKAGSPQARRAELRKATSPHGAPPEGAERPGDADEVRKTIDAVSGATWGARNRIMAGLFQRDLRTRGDDMPAFAPPGEDIPR